MWKLMCVFAVTGVCAAATSTSASAASGGNANAGDVWLDTGQLAGPGHEMDPHLGCTNINLYGSGLSDTGGTFSIDGWPPSGTQEADYSDNWSYSQASGDQVIAVIDVLELIQQAQANGDQPSAQGYHFKLEFSQDPQKHKTFWVSCDPGSTGGGGSDSGGGSSSGGGPSGDDGSSAGVIPAPPGTTGAPLAAVKTSISATHKTRRKHRRHKRARPARHGKHAVRRRLPAFTG